MTGQMQQTAVDFQPHRIDIYSALYLFHRALWYTSKWRRKIPRNSTYGENAPRDLVVGILKFGIEKKNLNIRIFSSGKCLFPLQFATCLFRQPKQLLFLKLRSYMMKRKKCKVNLVTTIGIVLTRTIRSANIVPMQEKQLQQLLLI